MSDADEVEVLRAQNEFLLNRLRAIRDNADICLPPHMKAPPAPCHHLHRTFGYDGPICQSCGQVIPEMTPEEAAQLAADIAEIRASRSLPGGVGPDGRPHLGSATGANKEGE